MEDKRNKIPKIETFSQSYKYCAIDEDDEQIAFGPNVQDLLKECRRLMDSGDYENLTIYEAKYFLDRNPNPRFTEYKL